MTDTLHIKQHIASQPSRTGHSILDVVRIHRETWLYPEGTEVYMVTSVEPSCTHNPPCGCHDMVFCYQGHFLVVLMSELMRVTPVDVRERLLATVEGGETKP